MIVSHQHPAKLVTRQAEYHPSFWITQRIPPAPMKTSAFTSIMDDFGTLAQLDYLALACSLQN